MFLVKCAQWMVVAGWCLTFWPHAGVAQVPANADPMDAARAERYAGRLQGLQESRSHLRTRAASLLAHNPNLEQELLAAMRSQLMAVGALRATPDVIATPQLLQSFRAYRGQSGELILQPEYLIWYALQDNTLARQQLMLQIAGAQREAALSYSALESSRVALEQVATTADENFLDFRMASDLMGRRSAMELGEAERLTAPWLQEDPMHAGAALVRAYALRAMGRNDECRRLLESLDKNFPAMQSILHTVSAQIAFLGGNRKDADRLIELGLSKARAARTGEAYLVAGWFEMADQKWSKAKSLAAQSRQFDANSLEAAILEALASAYERPGRSRDALQILRRAQLKTSPDDWQYHEALALVHMLARDPQFAKREIAAALAVAPTHVRAELEREQQEIDNGQPPAVDWHARLKSLWLR